MHHTQREPAANVSIYVITPQWSDTRRLLNASDQALNNGVSLLQYRDKLRDFNAQLAVGRALAQLCRQYAVPFIVNDNVELAVQLEADGVHLGQHDGAIESAINSGLERVGISCYNQLSRAVEAAKSGATEVAFGSFYQSSTKPDAVTAKPSLLADFIGWRSDAISPRLVAIGGINADNAKPLALAGAEYLAVSGAIYAADDVAAATRNLINSVN
ncbi:MAG: thiamine-phosphate synthase [Lysobacteraceae bacterium]|nr:MAG: thiamine-phosphate synthase [Xanthomonadaceae bacterium]